MKKGTKYFVRIDKKVEGKTCSKVIFHEHIHYLENIAINRSFYGGGFTNHPGGMIAFTATNLEEAKEIADNDPIISNGYYTYDIYEWDLIIASK